MVDDHDLGSMGLLSEQDAESAAKGYMINLGVRTGINIALKGGGVGGITTAAGLWKVIGSQTFKGAFGKIICKLSIAATIISFPLYYGLSFKDSVYLDEAHLHPWVPEIQYEIRPNTLVQTPAGDTRPDLVGPGKGDVYIGEGWTLALRDHYRFGIVWDETAGAWENSTNEVKTYTIEQEKENQYVYTVRDIQRVIADLNDAINGLADDSDEKDDLENSRDTWQELLDQNLAYEWDRYYVGTQAKIDKLEAKTVRTTEEDDYLSELQGIQSKIDAADGDAFEAFKDATGLEDDTDIEMLLFSGGPVYEYSRSISEGHFATHTYSTFVRDTATLSTHFTYDTPPHSLYPTGLPVFLRMQVGSGFNVGNEDRFSHSMESGQAVEQTVGFRLHDDDVGDRLVTYVCADPHWGTPLFFQDAGSRTSDPWGSGNQQGSGCYTRPAGTSHRYLRLPGRRPLHTQAHLQGRPNLRWCNRCA